MDKKSAVDQTLQSTCKRFSETVFLQSTTGARHVTFAEFHQAVAETAGVLKVAAGERIAVCCQDQIGFMIVTAALMFGGAVVVPVDPRLKSGEIADLFSRIEVQRLVGLTEEFERFDFPKEMLADASLHRLPKSRVEISTFPVGKSHTNEYPSAPGMALILSTSGSTSKPKAVPLTLKHLVTNATYILEHYQIRPKEISLCVLPLHHIHGFMLHFLVPLLGGGTLIIPEKSEALGIWDLVAKFAVNWLSAVPPIISVLLRSRKVAAESLASLRFVRVGSGPISAQDFSAFEERFHVPLLPGFGITEGSCVVTGNPPPPKARKPGSSGIPIGDYQIKIVNDEIHIKGACVFAGYLNDPAATQESVKDGWFSTGDLGYLDNEGFLFVTGRKKEIINVGGEKMLPAELELVLRKMPEIREAVVAGASHPIFGEYPMAFVQLKQPMSVTEAQIRDFCSRHIASFKMPKVICFVEEFPRTATGKIRRSLLVQKYANSVKV